MIDPDLARLARIAMLPALLLILGVLILPTAMLLAAGLALPWDGSGIGRALGGSLVISMVAAALATAIAIGVAAACRHAGRRVRDIVMTLSAVPLSLSVLITAFAFILLFGRSGTITLLLVSMGVDTRAMTAAFYGPPGLVLIYLHMLTPRALSIVMPVVSGLDMTVFQVARALGAGPLRAARDTLWPQVARACASAWSLCFAVAVGSYAAALVLLGTKAPLLSVLLVAKLGDNATDSGASGQIAMVIVGLCLAGAFAATLSFSSVRRHT